MTTFLVSRRNRIWLFAIGLLAACGSAHATLILDKGIYLAGPFEVPDINQPPSASGEAVFLAGAGERAPLFLNELVVASDGSHGSFSNNGWVNSAFTANIDNRGNVVWINWDLSGSGYALTYISVNFDNNFYHVYSCNPSVRSEGQVSVTGNLRDVISHIHFFGISTVPDSASTALMLMIGVAGVIVFRRSVAKASAR